MIIRVNFLKYIKMYIHGILPILGRSKWAKIKVTPSKKFWLKMALG